MTKCRICGKEMIEDCVNNLNFLIREAKKEVFDDFEKEYTVKEVLIIKKSGYDANVKLSEVAQKFIKIKKRHLSTLQKAKRHNYRKHQ